MAGGLYVDPTQAFVVLESYTDLHHLFQACRLLAPFLLLPDNARNNCAYKEQRLSIEILYEKRKKLTQTKTLIGI